MRNVFINTLVDIAETDDRIWLLTPDMGFSVVEPFQERFPERFLNVGIAEQNAVGIAAGLAMSGKIPYVYSIMPFVSARPYEQVRVDCAYMNTNVRLVGIGAGFAYGAAGATHHGIDEINIMRGLPNMSVVAPGDLTEAEMLVRYSVRHKGPMFIRLNKKGEPRYNHSVSFGKIACLQKGETPAIIATSSMLPDVVNAADNLRHNGLNPIVLSAHTIKPFDTETILELLDKSIPIISVEEHNIIGGLASAISEVIARSGKAAKFLPIAIPDDFSHYVGSQGYIKEKMGLGNLSHQIMEFMK